jgi:Multidrug resistance efflux pump
MMYPMKKSHNVILIIIAVVIMIGLSVAYYFYWEGKVYFSTENAKVSTDYYTILPSGSGKLVKLNISKDSFVKKDEVIGRAENGPFIKSPVNGQVVKSDVVLNQDVAASTVIAVIADTDNINITANIEETDITKVKEGQEVSVKLDAFPGKTFKAHVKEINKVTQSALSGNATSFSTSGTYTKVTQLIPVKIVLDEDVQLEGLLGTNAYVKIKVR